MPDDWQEIRTALDSIRLGFPAAEARLVLQRADLQDALLSDLERIAANPAEEATEGMLHIVGTCLLAQLRDRRLGPPLLALVSGPDEEVDALWGDWLTETWSHAAAAVCDSAALKRLVEDPDRFEWSRAMACAALTIQVFEGELDRHETVAYAASLLESMLRRRRENPDDVRNDLIVDFLADIVGDLGEAKDLPLLERWFADGELDPMHAGIDHYRGKLAMDFGDRREKERRSGGLFPQDAVAELSSAHCYSKAFHEPARAASEVRPAERLVHSADDGAYVRAATKVGRNDPCPCGSGRKYKKCCGAAAN